MQLVVGANELKILHRWYRHAAVEVQAIVSVRVGGFPRLKKKHVAASTVFNVGQLRECRMDDRWGRRGEGRDSDREKQRTREDETQNGADRGDHGEGVGLDVMSSLCFAILPITLMNLCRLRDRPTPVRTHCLLHFLLSHHVTVRVIWIHLVRDGRAVAVQSG